jgi:hypothetical protein
MPHSSVPNITKMVQYGYESGATGVLNTCWGDYGQISPIYACMYGMIFGAAKSWNATSDYVGFDEAIDTFYCGYKGGADIVKKIALAHKNCYWYNLLVKYSNEKFGNERMKLWKDSTPEEYNEAFAEIEELISRLNATTWENESARKALLVVAEGVKIIIAMLVSRTTGEQLGINFNDEGKMVGDVDFKPVSEIVEAITPVPGGVGSMTTTLLMKHVIEAAEKAMGK